MLGWRDNERLKVNVDRGDNDRLVSRRRRTNRLLGLDSRVHESLAVRVSPDGNYGTPLSCTLTP